VRRDRRRRSGRSSWSATTASSGTTSGASRAQPRAELRAEPADGSGDRLRHDARPAGTGKTLLTLAAGLAQTLESNRFSEIIMTRVTIPLGEDIGFLPGTEEEKMEPWMGALMDNLEVLTQSQEAATGAAPRPTTCCATGSRSAR
jgi:hypothetical protein